MGSLLGSGLLGRRHRQSMESRPVVVLAVDRIWMTLMMQGHMQVLKEDKGELTGPMMVACQWN